MIRKWIVLNHKELLEFWNDVSDDGVELLQQLKSISGHEDDPDLNWDNYLANLKPDVTPKVNTKNQRKNKNKS